MRAKDGVIMRFMDTNLLSRITTDPDKCGGAPCIRGTRMRVEDLLELLRAGASFEEILRDYRFLEQDDIQATLLYETLQLDQVLRLTKWDPDPQ